MNSPCSWRRSRTNKSCRPKKLRERKPNPVPCSRIYCEREGQRTTRDSAENHFLAASSLRADKKYQEALKESDAAIAADPKSARAYIGRALVNNELGRYKEAISDCNQAITLNPQDPTAYNNRGWPACASTGLMKRSLILAKRSPATKRFSIMPTGLGGLHLPPAIREGDRRLSRGLQDRPDPGMGKCRDLPDPVEPGSIRRGV